MAETVKANNGAMTVKALTEVTNKADNEAKALIETMLTAMQSANENSKQIIDLQQQMLKSSFNLWKEYSQGIINFVFDTGQLTIDQMMAIRERFGIILENELKKMQELATSEQELILDAAEVMQAQARTTSENVAELFTPILTKPISRKN